MESIAVYSPSVSNRLTYVLDWLLKERLHMSYTLTADEAAARRLPFCIAYGKELPNALCVPDSRLLWQKGSEQVEVKTGAWKDLPVLFAHAGASENTLPFDLFSALFFLLSRYEEYYPNTPDKHGRYAATNSILYKNGWLHRPLADEWVCALRKLLVKAGQNIPEQHFSYQPSYDIDMAYSHLHKGVTRIVGAYVRALLKGDILQISERTQVLKKKQKDPFDSFRWLRQQHKQYGYKPVYFVLSASKRTAFDKNIHPQHPAMMRVTRNLVKEGDLGIHPSYFSDQHDTMAVEKKMLEFVAGAEVHISRQHYIKVKMPDTYYQLIKLGITDDYSMGYGAHLGFRAGTGSSFLWYDLKNETVSPLRIHPFCFMDTTAHYEAKLGVSDSFERLNAMTRILEETGSRLVTIFHNFSLGTSSEWKGWRLAYEHFLQEKSGGG
jgi:hypothetical protein